MASLDSLPADQRAVLQLVLQRGRTYDEIADMLSIDRAAVRERALSAFDALGPNARIAAPQRALITDYLLGQLPDKVAEQTRERLGTAPADRAWARVIASEIGPLASSPLPEIPAGTTRREAAAEPERVAAVAFADEDDDTPRIPRDYGLRPPQRELEDVRANRRGGAVLLALTGLVIAVVVIVLIATGGSSSKHPASASTPSTSLSTPTGSTSTPATSTTGTTTNGAQLVAQINLASPTGAKSTAGVAQVIRERSTTGVVILAQGMPANTKHDAYAVWLYNSPTDAYLLGFVSQRVGTTGKLETAGRLPPNASHFKQLLVSVETQQKPKAPDRIVLEGQLSLS